MYSTKQKVIDTLAQRGNDKFYAVKQNLRQRPACSIHDIRIVYKKEGGAIQKAGDKNEPELYQQIGPSCWLFVMEALVRHEGFDTKYLQMIMHSYESDADKIRDKKNANPEFRSRRVAALSATRDKLYNLVLKLTNYISNKDERGNTGDIISKKHAERLMFRAIGNTFISKYIFQGQAQEIQCTVLKEKIEETIKKLDSLIKTSQNSEHDIDDFFNAGSVQIDQNQELTDIESVLEHIKNPSYMRICKIYKSPVGNMESNMDFTRRTRGDLEDTVHAVLLIDYNKSNRTVKYKAPNYGDDIIFTVTTEQLQWMAGEKPIIIRTFYAGNAGKSKLADALDLTK